MAAAAKKKTKATGKTGRAKPRKAVSRGKPAVKTAKGKAPAKKKAAKASVTRKASAAKKTTATIKTATKKAAAKKPAARRTVTRKAVAPADNRRRFDRRETRIPAELEHGDRKIAGAVTNLSLQGCLFTPPQRLKPGTRVRLKLSGESKPVTATVKAVSEQGVHCLLHAGGATLSRLSTDLDDMALLMLSAGRPTSMATGSGS